MLETLAWAAAGLALLSAGLTAWNLLLYRAPPRPAAAGTGAPPPTVSVLIPARNEADTIEAAVRAVLANRDVELELIVLDDASTDATAAIVAALAAEDGRVRLERAPPLPPGWSGKQHACHVLGGLARHELLVFVDADVRLAPDALGRMAAFLGPREAALASGVPHQETGSFFERLLIPLILVLLLGYLPMAGMRLSRLAGFGAGCGQLFIARRAAYRRAGGHAAIRASLHDGVTLPRAFRRAGFGTDLFDATDIATCRMYRGARQVWDGFSKNATEGMATPAALPVWTVLLAGGHVLPWLLLAAGAAAGLPAGVTVPAALGVAAALAQRLALALRFRQPLPEVLLHPVAILVLLALQWTALIRAARGRAPTWRGRAYPQG